MPLGVTEQDVKVAACVIAASKMIEAPQLPPECWMGLARSVLEEVERYRNELRAVNALWDEVTAPVTK